MAGQRNCDSVVAAGRMSKAIEFFDAADHLGEEMPGLGGLAGRGDDAGRQPPTTRSTTLATRTTSSVAASLTHEW